MVLGFRDLGLFCEKSPICRGLSTSVEGQTWPLRHEDSKEIATEKASPRDRKNTEEYSLGKNRGSMTMSSWEAGQDRHVRVSKH